jgi:hypothetical protein
MKGAMVTPSNEILSSERFFVNLLLKNIILITLTNNLPSIQEYQNDELVK